MKLSKKLMIGIFYFLIVAKSVAQMDGQAQVHVLQLNGAIGPATRDYVIEGIQQAQSSQARLIIIQMDTPGGLSESMRDIIKEMLNTSVPIVTWVGPSGARAASAGTYILYASHIAAMAPSTHLGAATPVAIGGSGSTKLNRLPDNSQEPDDQQKDQMNSQPSASEKKSVEDAVAYIRSLADRYQRNAEWAEEAVRDAASITSAEALEKGVIDVIAKDIPTLIQQINGQTVNTKSATVTLDINENSIYVVKPDWRNQLLSVITNPTFAYILLMIGIYGLILEGYNPGAFVPGVVGGICLLMALYAFQILPINYAGLALIALGIGLIVAEMFVPSLGILGIGGVVALVFGSIILMDTDIPGFAIPMSIIVAVAVMAGLILLGTLYLLKRAYHKPQVAGADILIGQKAQVIQSRQSDHLRVHVNGEDWTAHCQHTPSAGQWVRVVDRNGLILVVEIMEKEL